MSRDEIDEKGGEVTLDATYAATVAPAVKHHTARVSGCLELNRRHELAVDEPARRARGPVHSVVLPFRPVYTIRHRNVAGCLGDFSRGIPGGLICVLDGILRVRSPDFEVGLLDLSELRRPPKREHGSDRTGRALGASIHADRQVPIAEGDGLDFGSRLEGIVAHSPHDHVRLGPRARVRVPVEVDVVCRVDHEHRGVASGSVRVASHEGAVVPGLDGPHTRPGGIREVAVRHGSVGAAMGVVNRRRHSDVLGLVPEIEKAVVGEVMRRSRVRLVAVAS